MNKIFKVIFSKNIGRMVIVSENAKGQSKKSTGTKKITEHCGDVVNAKVLIKIIVPTLFLGMTSLAFAVGADDNYSHNSTDVALGKASGVQHQVVTQNGKITSISGIAIEASSTDIDSISSFTLADGIKITNPTQLANFKQALKTGANIAVGGNSSALGIMNLATGDQSTAVGGANIASGFRNSAFGTDNWATGMQATAVGNANEASGGNSSAIGVANQALGVWATAVGNTNLATKNHSSAFGSQNKATAEKSTAVGVSNWATNENSSALGSWNEASGIQATAVGHFNVASAQNSSVFGSNSIAWHTGATALGNNSATDRDNSISVGKLGAEKQITFVKAGTADTDAVNLAQVKNLLGNVSISDDNYSHNSTDTVLGNASGIEHNLTIDNGEITSIEGIAIEASSNTIDSITSYTSADGIKITNPTQLADFKQALKTGANIAVGGNSLAVGSLNIASGKAGSAVGFGNKASGNSGSAVGYSNRASGASSSAVGYLNTASGAFSSAFGSYNTASAQNSSVFGSNSIAWHTGATALGNNSATDRDNSISVGKAGAEKQITFVKAGTADTDAVNKKQMDTAVGSVDSKVTLNTNAITALGGRVTINSEDISALKQGQGSLSQLAVQYDSSATQDSITLKGASGTKLTNLQEGDISTSASKDAVTGGQLFSTNQNLTALTGQVSSNATQFANALGGGAGFNNGVFTAPSYTIQGSNYSNVGAALGAVNSVFDGLKGAITTLKNYVDEQDAKTLLANKNYSDVQGKVDLDAAKQYADQQGANILAGSKGYTDQKANETLTQAKGYTDTETAKVKDYTDQQVKDASQYIQVNGAAGGTPGGSGDHASATGVNAISIGANSTVNGNNSTAVGSGNTVVGNNSTVVGVGHQVTGDRSGAFGDPSVITGNGSYAYGNDNTITGNSNHVVGNDNMVKGENTLVLGNNVSAEANNAVVLGNNSTTTRDNTVSVGSKDKERQITNVANATEATDAVNLRQMQAAHGETLKSANSYTDTRINQLESSFTDFSVQTDRRFKEVDKRFERQGAMSVAMMNMAMSTSGLRGLNRVGVGAGFQGDAKAVAIGYQRVVNENVNLNFGGAFTEDESSGGAGVGFSW